MIKIDKNKLRVKWSKRENDHVIHYPRKCDGGLVQSALFGQHFHSPLHIGETEPSLAEELEKRGYDLTTLKFEIKRKPHCTHCQQLIEGQAYHPPHDATQDYCDQTCYQEECSDIQTEKQALKCSDYFGERGG